MKKSKKHNFKYKEPEKTAAKSAIKNSEKIEAYTEETSVAMKDFRKAALVIAAFIVVIIALYLFKEPLKIQELSKIIKF